MPRPDSQQQALPPWALLVAVFAVAMSVLGFEVALTRAFSVLLRFHFVFLAISLATCGSGIGGLLDFLLRRTVLKNSSPHSVLIVSGSVAAVLIPLAFYLLFATRLSALLTSVWIVTLICLPPFLAAGAFLSHAFAWYSSQGGRLYFADLFGAALGSFLVIGALQLMGGINAGIVWGFVVAAGICTFALGTGQIRLAPFPAVICLAVAAVLFVNRTGGVIDLPVMPLVNDPNAKPLFQELGEPSIGAKIVDTEWNAFARTDVVSNEGTDDLYIYTDGEVPTNMIKFDGNLQELLPRLVSFIGFYAFFESQPDNVLLIGPGGGLDVLLALAVNAKQIEGAELNPSIPRLARKYGEMNGNVYDIEGVDIRVDEGRSFVSRSEKKYDLIYMALTKTATTTTSSLALLESYVHTTEAFDEYIEHLSDDGAFGFVCQSPLILLRAMLTARNALEATGIDGRAALDHICLMSVPQQLMGMGPYRYLMFVGRKPFGPERAGKLAEDCIAMGLEPAYFPGVFVPEPFKTFTERSMDNDQFVTWWNEWQHTDAKLDFAPCTDDRPFVVDMSVGMPPQFARFMWAAVVLVILLTICVGAWVKTTSGTSVPSGGALGGAALFFALLGIGFMLVEVVLTQRLVLYLGYPVLTLSVILFSLLLGSGMGSLWSQSWAVGRGLALRGAAGALAIAVGAIAVYWLHPLIVDATLAWDIRLRCAITMALLLPLGFAMGTPFPTGIRIVGEWTADLVPWMWGINGVTSVVGSVGAMALAKLLGFGAVLVVGTAIYAVAALVALAYYLVSPGISSPEPSPPDA